MKKQNHKPEDKSKLLDDGNGSSDNSCSSGSPKGETPLSEYEYDGGWYHKTWIKQAVKRAERRINEVINMEWSKGMEYILEEVKEIFLGEFGFQEDLK